MVCPLNLLKCQHINVLWKSTTDTSNIHFSNTTVWPWITNSIAHHPTKGQSNHDRKGNTWLRTSRDRYQKKPYFLRCTFYYLYMNNTFKKSVVTHYTRKVQSGWSKRPASEQTTFYVYIFFLDFSFFFVLFLVHGIVYTNMTQHTATSAIGYKV